MPISKLTADNLKESTREVDQIEKLNEVIDALEANVSGTTNTLAKFTGTNAVGNSSITDNGTTVATSLPIYISTTDQDSLRPWATSNANTASGVDGIDARSIGTFDTTAGNIETSAVSGSAYATRSAGSNSLINYAFYGYATGGQFNYSFYGSSGDFYQNGVGTFTGNLTVNGSVFDHNGDLAKFGSSDGMTFVSGQTIGFEYSTNATATGYINWRGYQAGTSQFRDLVIGDGKEAVVAAFAGSTKTLNVLGGIQVNGTSVATTSNISGTTNTLAKFTGTNTVGNSGFTDDGTTADINRDITKFGSAVDGQTYISGNTINVRNDLDDDTGQMVINQTGYAFGTTRFRDLIVRDGKAATIATFTGSDKSLAVVGNLSTNGNLTATGSAKQVALVAADGTLGFYGATPVALQTGVAVSAAGIHAALVALGLITA